jgi:hypothetical protein
MKVYEDLSVKLVHQYELKGQLMVPIYNRANHSKVKTSFQSAFFLRGICQFDEVV